MWLNSTPQHLDYLKGWCTEQYFMSEAYYIRDQTSHQISSRVRVGVPFGGAEVALRHNRYQYREYSYHLQMGEGFPVSTCIFIHSFILSFFLFPAHTCDHPTHTTQGPTPGAQDAPSDLVTVYLFSLLCALTCATLHLSVLASSPLWPRKFLQVFEDNSDPRVLTRSSGQTKIGFWTLWISI